MLTTRHRFAVGVATALFLSLATSSMAQTFSLPTTRATRTSIPIRIDGKLDESAWADAPLNDSQFIQRLPYAGRPATEATNFRILYDDDNLYFGIHCRDSHPDELTTRTRRFDSPRLFEDDYVAVKIDSAHDKRTVLYFAVTPNGTQLDAKSLNNGASFLKEWDTLWDVSTHRDETGWYAEFKIPFTSMEYDPSGASTFLGLNITRFVARLAEEFDWAPIPPPFIGLNAGYYGLLERVPVPAKKWRQLSLIPYLSTGVTQDTAGLLTGSSTTELEPFLNYGGDAKYPLTRGSIAQATIKTDFSQVDIDAQQANLTRFNLFFPEKRTFFLEGAQFFDFGFQERSQLFFSRRIGLEDDSPVPLLGGVRSYGTVQRYEYGVLNLQTEKRQTALIDVPARNFTVARLRRNIFEKSQIGFIATDRIDTDNGDGHNATFGFDANIKSVDERLAFKPYAAISLSSPDSYHPVVDDPDSIDGAGVSALQLLSWSPGDWELTQYTLMVGEDFNPAVGFLQRSGIIRQSFEVAKNFYFPGSSISKTRYSVYGTGITDEDAKDLLDYYYGADLVFVTQESYSLTFYLDHSHDTVQTPFSLNGQVTIPVGEYDENLGEVIFATPLQYGVSGQMEYSYGGIYGGTLHQFEPSISVRAIQGLYFNAASSLSFIDLPQLNHSFVTGVYNLALSYSPSQPMALDFKSGWDQEDGSILFQYRYRWRYHPLSDFFVVYNEQRNDNDFGATFRSLAFKIAYYFQL